MVGPADMAHNSARASDAAASDAERAPDDLVEAYTGTKRAVSSTGLANDSSEPDQHVVRVVAKNTSRLHPGPGIEKAVVENDPLKAVTG